MYVYNVRTIPVPYHINSEMIDETESEKAYTQIIPDTEMVAMNRDTYINVDHSELKQCIKFSVMYFCEQTFLMKHTSEHTCETAIYHEQRPDLIKDKCNIQYYPELDLHHKYWMQENIYYYSGRSRISQGGGMHPLGGVDLQCGHFLVKMYAKMKELGPIGGRVLGMPPSRSTNIIRKHTRAMVSCVE